MSGLHLWLTWRSISRKKHNPGVLRQFRLYTLTHLSAYQATGAIDPVALVPCRDVPVPTRFWPCRVQSLRDERLLSTSKAAIDHSWRLSRIKVTPEEFRSANAEELQATLDISSPPAVHEIGILPPHKWLIPLNQRVQIPRHNTIDIHQQQTRTFRRHAMHLVSLQFDSAKARNMTTDIDRNDLNEIFHQIGPVRYADPPMRNSEIPGDHPIPDADVIGTELIRSLPCAIFP
jgi:hypothetical protein